MRYFIFINKEPEEVHAYLIILFQNIIKSLNKHKIVIDKNAIMKYFELLKEIIIRKKEENGIKTKDKDIISIFKEK